MLSFKIFENVNWSDVKKSGFDIFPRDILIKLEELKEKGLILDWFFDTLDSESFYDEDTQERIESSKVSILCIDTKLTKFTKYCDLDEIESTYKLISKIESHLEIDEDQFMSLPEVKKFIDCGFDVDFDKGHIMLTKKKNCIINTFSLELTTDGVDIVLNTKANRSRSKTTKIELSPIKEMQNVLHYWLDQYEYLLEK